MLGLLLGLAACAPQPSRPVAVGIAPPIGQPAAPRAPEAPRAAMLLPLSGPQAPLGRSLLNAGILALFDESSGGIEIVPADTGGAPGGAAAAARRAIADGARMLIGPLTSAEAAAVAPVARAAGVPMLAFTNDAQRAGENAWVLGTTPQQQVRRVVAAAAREGARRFALAAPDNDFGRALVEALRGAAQDLTLPPPTATLYPPNADPGMAATAARLAAPQAEALLIGEGSERAQRFAMAYLAETRAGAGAGSPPRLLGTALWAGDLAPRHEALAGAWFPGPDPGARRGFDSRYREAFGGTPPRIAAAAYDAAALAVRALRSGQPLDSLTALRSFAGAEGPVRLLPGGQTLRGLALFAVVPEAEPSLVEPAAEPAGPGT